MNTVIYDGQLCQQVGTTAIWLIMRFAVRY